MQIDQTGIILITRHYAECCRFYKEALGLPVLFELDRPGSVLTAFDFGGAYLMVEPADASDNLGQPSRRMKLRLNVDDVPAAATALADHGVEVVVKTHDWGMTAEFVDPDGNRCALRSLAGFRD